MDEHLPDGHTSVDVREEPVRQGRQPRIDGSPLRLPTFAQLVDRRQWFRFRLGSFVGALCFESDAPALGSAEVMDEDPAQTALADDVRPRPQERVQVVEDAQHAEGRRAVIGEQEADLFGQHRSSSRAHAGRQRARS
jgi:hypothetical protein